MEAERNHTDNMSLKNQRHPVLLHSCCGPCSTAVIERLIPSYPVTVFFYNPNITDREEYEKRKETQIQFLQQYNRRNPEAEPVGFLEGRYDPERYLEWAKGLEDQPEGGSRCTQCFRLRLLETAEKAAEMGFLYFATTLSVSPHKNFPLIAEIGEAAAEKYGIVFLAEDFKKKAGYQRSIEMSKEFSLYRQNFCGCEFAK